VNSNPSAEARQQLYLNLSHEARLLYLLLWTVADDAGQLPGEPRDLAGMLYPDDDDAQSHINSWIGELETTRFIRRGEHLFIASYQSREAPRPSNLTKTPMLQHQAD
jgi:hypothetical protein